MNFGEQLPATEKQNYLDFHEAAFEEDMRHSEHNILLFPRWSIISAYYSMHNITKLFLAKLYNIKIISPEIHAKTIAAIDQAIQEKELKEKLIHLLNQAKEIYYNAERLKEKILPTLLRKGKQERTKSQYYTQDYTEQVVINSQKASYFLDKIAQPYIKLIKELMK